MKLFRLLLISFLCSGLLGCQPQEVTNTAEKQTKPVENKDKSSAKKTKKQIVFFGDSLTAAYGIDPEDGFTTLIQRKIDSLGLSYQVVNAGNSGETSSGGESRVAWILKQAVDIFVLELGGNDALRGISPELSYRNLQSIIDQVRAKSPEAKILIAGMLAPPNMGPDFSKKFAAMFPKLAEDNKAELIPFLLENVGGIPELNLADGIHPTPKGHQIVAENIWAVLEGML